MKVMSLGGRKDEVVRQRAMEVFSRGKMVWMMPLPKVFSPMRSPRWWSFRAAAKISAALAV